MVKFKDFSRPLSVFPVLFKANLIFKDFSRQSYIFKYFSSLCQPCTVYRIQKYTFTLSFKSWLKSSALSFAIAFCPLPNSKGTKPDSHTGRRQSKKL